MAACSCFMSSTAHSANPVDASFGVASQYFVTSANLYGVSVNPTGDVYTAGESHSSCSGYYAPVVAAFKPDGQPNPAFGAAGKVDLSAFAICGFSPSIAAQADGSIVGVVRASRNLIVYRLTASGQLDRAFGTDGVVSLSHPWITDGHPRIRIDGNGLIVIGWEESAYPLPKMRLGATRLRPDGSLDVTFGEGGSIYAQIERSCAGYETGLTLQPDGKIVVAGNGYRSNPPSAANWNADAVLVRFLPDGAIDPSFGASGVAANLFAAANQLYVIDSQGEQIVASADVGGAPGAFRLTSTGSLDGSFGQGGFAHFQNMYSLERYPQLVVDKEMNIVLATGLFLPNGGQGIGVARFGPDGQPDQSFGDAGLAAVSSWAGYAAEFALDSSGRVYLGFETEAIRDGNWIGGLAVARILPDGGAPIPYRAGEAIEFYDSDLKHYFITADTSEASGIDAGAAGPGWSRTGNRFKVWLTPNTNSATLSAAPVCRFYGTRGVGPNSHFYTAEPDECTAVKSDRGWTFEGVVMYLQRPNATCPAGTVPVYRNYNNRFAFNDSNHRYSTDIGVYQQMSSQGWVGEGIVMCSPQ
jgi:uncharacterized delta-60 repeat protein